VVVLVGGTAVAVGIVVGGRAVTVGRAVADGVDAALGATVVAVSAGQVAVARTAVGIGLAVWVRAWVAVGGMAVGTSVLVGPAEATVLLGNDVLEDGTGVAFCADVVGEGGLAVTGTIVVVGGCGEGDAGEVAADATGLIVADGRSPTVALGDIEGVGVRIGVDVTAIAAGDAVPLPGSSPSLGPASDPAAWESAGKSTGTSASSPGAGVTLRTISSRAISATIAG
jgi:hypothetical protein